MGSLLMRRIVFLFQGISMLLPFNFFISASIYFDHEFSKSKTKEYKENFEFVFPMAFMISNFIFYLGIVSLRSFQSSIVRDTKRILVSSIIYEFIFFSLTAIVLCSLLWPHSGAISPKTLYALSISFVIICGAANSVFQGSTFSIAASMSNNNNSNNDDINEGGRGVNDIHHGHSATNGNNHNHNGTENELIQRDNITSNEDLQLDGDNACLSDVMNGQAVAGTLANICALISIMISPTDEKNDNSDVSDDDLKSSRIAGLVYFWLASFSILLSLYLFIRFTKYDELYKNRVAMEAGQEGIGNTQTDGINLVSADALEHGTRIESSDEYSQTQQQSWIQIVASFPSRLFNDFSPLIFTSSALTDIDASTKSDIRYHQVTAVLTLTLSLVVFPGFISKIRPTQEAFSKDAFQQLMFLCFNFGDLIGRIAFSRFLSYISAIGSVIDQAKKNSRNWALISLLRGALLIFFIFETNMHMSDNESSSDKNKRLGIFGGSDAWPIIFVLLLGLSNGYLISRASVFAPLLAPNDQKAEGGKFIGFLCVSSVTLGTVISVILQKIL